jgi:hypothetical protein
VVDIEMPAICAWPWPADNVVGDQQNTGIGRGEAEGTDADARPEFPADHIGIDFGAPARKVRRTTPKPARNFTQGARQTDKIVGNRADGAGRPAPIASNWNEHLYPVYKIPHYPSWVDHCRAVLGFAP